MKSLGSFRIWRWPGTTGTMLWLAVLGAMATSQENWPRWRGPQDTGSTLTGQYASVWTAEGTRWKAALPGKGCSTPVVWEDRIVVTAPVNQLDAVLAYDWSGKLLWQTTLGPETAGKHRNGSGSNSSPVTDEQGVFVYFKSGDFAALAWDGKVRWRLNLVERFGRENLYWDHGTSPVLTERHVIMVRMHEGDSWVAAFDKETGAMAWKTARNYETPTEGDHGYGTPIVHRHEGREAILIWGAQHLTSYDAKDGALIWSCGGFNPENRTFWPTVATPVLVGEVAVVPFGRADKGQPRLHGVRLGGQGDVTATHRLWQRDDVGTFVPTPAAQQGRVYVLSDRGQVACLDPVNGRTVWQGVLPRSSSNFYASPLVADGKLYAVREDGVVFVVGIANGFELVSEINMGERMIASPVAVAGRLLLRGEEHLYCVGTP